jgi:hypothetical protein
MSQILEDGETERVFFEEAGEMFLLRCAICSARVDAGSYETGSLGARYCSDECVMIAKAFGVFGKSRILVGNRREADDIIEAWEQELERPLQP